MRHVLAPAGAERQAAPAPGAGRLPAGPSVGRSVPVPSPRAGGAPPARRRRAWMDVLRGIAIVLVVLTHVRAQAWRLFGIDEVALNMVVETVAPVRIPLLMLLSGMLLSRSLAKGPRTFLVGKLRGIAWPYVVWSLVYLAVWRLVPDLDGGRHARQGLGDLVDAPLSVLWYLHLLLGLYLVALALHQVPRARPAHWVALAGVVWGVSALGESPEWERAAALAFFFLAGDLLARRIEQGLPTALTRLWTSPLRRPLTLLTLVVATSPLVLWAWTVQPARYAPYSVLPVAAAMLLLALAARGAAGTVVERPLAWVGRQSLVFYVAHWLLIGLTFDALGLVLAPGQHPWTALGLVTAATLTGCTLLALAQQRLRVVGWLFAAPRRRAASRDRVQG